MLAVFFDRNICAPHIDKLTTRNTIWCSASTFEQCLTQTTTCDLRNHITKIFLLMFNNSFTIFWWKYSIEQYQCPPYSPDFWLFTTHIMGDASMKLLLGCDYVLTACVLLLSKNVATCYKIL